MIAGCVQQYGEQSFNIGRNAWLQAGLPIETPGHDGRPPVRLRPSRRSTSARALIAAGVHDVVIGGGVEHMGHIPMGVGFKWVDERRHRRGRRSCSSATTSSRRASAPS